MTAPHEVAEHLLGVAAVALAGIDGGTRPHVWLDLREPPRFPQLTERYGSCLVAWVQASKPVESRGRCTGPMRWPVRLRWWTCHPGWDENGLDPSARAEAARAVLDGAQAVQHALAEVTCGSGKPTGLEGLRSWSLGECGPLKPEAKTAGWEWNVGVVL